MKRKQPLKSLFDEPARTPVITNLRPSPRNPNLIQVRVDGRIAATLPTDDTAHLRLSEGQQWTNALAKRVEAAVSTSKIRTSAMKMLSARPLSKRELCDRLCKRGHDAGIVKKVVDDAALDGWLDEKSYADDLVRGVIGRRPAAKRLIAEKLRRHGLQEHIVQAASEQASASQDDRAAALQLARRRLATMSGVLPAAALRRIAGMLGRRGFDDEIIDATLEAIRLIVPDRNESD